MRKVRYYLVITPIFWPSAIKQHTKHLAAAAVCKAELYEDVCKASHELTGNHQNQPLDFVVQRSTLDSMIEIRELVWDEYNVPHIWERHQLVPEQVEETYDHRLRIIAPRPNGKLLVVILAPEGGGSYYVVTAKPAKRQELRRYAEWKAGKQL